MNRLIDVNQRNELIDINNIMFFSLQVLQSSPSIFLLGETPRRP